MINNLNPETIKLAIMASLAGWIGTTFKSIPSTLMNNFIYYTSKTTYANTDDDIKDYMLSTLALRKLTKKSFYTKHMSAPIQCEGEDFYFNIDDLYNNDYITESEFKELTDYKDRQIGIVYNVLYKQFPEGIHVAYLGEGTWARFTYSQTVRQNASGDSCKLDKVRKNLSINFIGVKANKYTSLYNQYKIDLLNMDRDRLDILRDREYIPTILSMYTKNGVVAVSRRLKETVFTKYKETILNTVYNFANSEDKYSALGIPYKLNILLHGEPGTGKTSLVKMIATHCTRNGAIYDWGAIREMDRYMVRGKNNKVERIVLLEEIDTIAAKRKEDSSNNASEKILEMLNTDGLKDILEVLDGTRTPHGLVSVSTTNHIEKLDPAILRRFDLVLEIGKLDIDEATEMCNAYGVDVNILNDIKLPINPCKLSRILFDKINIGGNN